MNTLDVTVPSGEFGAMLGRAQGVVNPRSPIPMLACVLLRADGSALEISASDLYIGVTSTMPAEVREPGAIALPLRELAERVKAMPAGPVHIRADDKLGVVMKSKVGNRRYVLRGADASEYPPLATPSEDATRASIATKTLAEILERSHYAMMPDDVDGAVPQRTSLFVEWDGERIRSFATDGHRMVIMSLPTTGRFGSARMMLSGKAVRELRRHCEDAFCDSQDVSLVTSGNTAFFSADGVMASIALVAADPYSFKTVLDTIRPPTTTARVAKRPTLDALRGVSLVADDSAINVRIADACVRIDSRSDKGGEGDDRVPAEVDGPEAGFSCTAKYLIDSITATSGEDVSIGVYGELDPVRVTSIDKADDYLGIVMPRRER